MGKRIDNRRSFSIDLASTGKKGGRYLNLSPFGAARKAATRIFKEAPGTTEIRYVIRETTKSSMSSNQRHYYSAKKMKDNRVVEKAGIKFTVTSKIEVKAIPEADVRDLLAKLPKHNHTVSASEHDEEPTAIPEL